MALLDLLESNLFDFLRQNELESIYIPQYEDPIPPELILYRCFALKKLSDLIRFLAGTRPGELTAAIIVPQGKG